MPMVAEKHPICFFVVSSVAPNGTPQPTHLTSRSRGWQHIKATREKKGTAENNTQVSIGMPSVWTRRVRRFDFTLLVKC